MQTTSLAKLAAEKNAAGARTTEPAAAREATSASGPSSWVDAAGAKIAVKRWGAGQAVLCLHATGHGSGDFEAFAARVSDKGYEVVALDWPGQGRSPPHHHPPRARWYAEIILEASAQLGLDRPILLGNSIGGAAAILAGAKAPERFAALVLCNPGGLAPLDAASRFVIRRMADFFDAGARGAGWFDGAFSFYYSHLVLPKPPAAAQRRRIVAAGRALAPLLAEAWRGFGEADADLRAVVRTLRLPVWYAWARDDRFVAWARSRRAAQATPNAVISLFPGGHAPFLETPDEFAEAFVAFARAHAR